MSGIVVRVASRGDGVTDDGRHVAFTAPGDTVADDGVVTAGPSRAVPPCRHFGTCGGCQLQHVDDDAYARFVVDRIGSALHEQRLDLPDTAPVHLSPPRTRRRASLRAERRGREVRLGFNAGGSHDIVDMRECHVLLPELLALVAPLRRLLVKILPERARVTVTMTRADQGIDVLLTGFAVEGLTSIEALSDFAAEQHLSRLSVDEGFGPAPHWCPQPPTVTLAGHAVALPDGAFLQATADGEATLVAAVGDATNGAGRVVDMFAGLGTFALSLNGAVTAVEGSRDAAVALLAVRKVKVEHRDLFRRPLTAGELDAFDAAVLDPPRAGAREQVRELAISSVPRIAYVSCNPATFARDARTLVDGGYRLDRITPVGQFRWSTHVELAAAFSR